MRTEIAIISALALVLSVPLVFAQVDSSNGTSLTVNGTSLTVNGTSLTVNGTSLTVNGTSLTVIDEPIVIEEFELPAEMVMTSERIPVSYTKPINLYNEGVNFYGILNSDGTVTQSSHYPYFETESGDFIPYRLNEDSSMIQVEVNGGKIVFDKNNGSMTLFNDDGIIVDSDSYVIRSALSGSDVWNNLPLNDEPLLFEVIPQGETLIIEISREDETGLFKMQHIVFGGKLKTTAFFTNYSLENTKIAFTETLNLPDNIITLNDQVIDLSQFVGQSFDRETLEQNEDLIIQVKEQFFNTGIGFDNLWQVNIHENNTVSLDYANTEHIISIGETIGLDPTWNITGTINGSNSDFDISSLGNAIINSGDISGTALTSSQITSLQSAVISGTTTWSQPFTAGAVWDTSNLTYSIASGYNTNSNPIRINTSSSSGGYMISLNSGGTGSIELSADQNRNGGSAAGTYIKDMSTNESFQINYPRSSDVHTKSLGGNNSWANAYASQCSWNDPHKLVISGSAVTAYCGSTVARSGGVASSSNFVAVVDTWGSNNGYNYWDVTATGDFAAAAPILTVIYTPPTVPDSPINLTTVTGVPVELDWSAPTDNGGMPITGYKVFRTDNQYAFTELPDNSANSAGIDFTNNEFLVKGFESQSTLTYEDDFSTDKGWTTSGSGTPTCTIDLTTDNRAEFSMASGSWTAPHCKDDLGLTLDDENFVLRFAVDIYSTFTTGANANIKIWLDDDGVVGGDAMGISINMNNLGANYDGIYHFANDGSAQTQAGSAHNGATAVNPANIGAQGYKGYFEIIRNDSNSMTVTEYSDSGYSNVVSTGTLSGGDKNVWGSGSWSNSNSQMTGVTGLSYLMFGLSNNDSQGGTWSMSLDDIEIYNGVTSADDITSLPDKSTNSIPVTLPSGSTETNPVAWQNAAGGISINGNTITKSGNSWGNGVQGTTTFTSSQGAELVFNVGSNTHHSMVGFGKDPFVADSSDIQYVMYPAANGTICFYENNVHLSSLCNTFTYTSSDDLKVKMDSNGVVTYWKNTTLLYTSTLQASGTYYVQASLYTGGVSVSADLITNPPPNTTASTTGVIDTGLQSPNLSYTDSNLPDGTDDFSIGSWVKLDPRTPTNALDNSFTTLDSGKNNISSGTLDFNVVRDGSSDDLDIDLGSVSDTEWVLRFKLDVDTVSPTSQYVNIGSIGLASVSGTGNTDFIGLSLAKSNDATYQHYHATDEENADGANYTTEQFSHGLQVETLYVEIIRSSATAYSIELFSDSGYTTSIESQSLTTTASTDGLQYFKVRNFNNGANVGGSIAGTIEDIKFYNGISDINTPPDNTKLLGLNDVTFNVGTDSASVVLDNLVNDGLTLNSAVSNWGSPNCASYQGGNTGNSFESSVNYCQSVAGTFDTSTLPSGLTWSKVTAKSSQTTASAGDCAVYPMTSTSSIGNNAGTWNDAKSGTPYATVTNCEFGTDGIELSSQALSDFQSKYSSGGMFNLGMSGVPAGGSSPSNIHSGYSELVLESGGINYIITATGLSDNTSSPQHYTFTRDGNDWEIYQNSVSEATATDTTSLGSNIQTDSTKDGTNNGATTGVTGKIGNAWEFDGSNDYVDLNNSMISGTGDFTLTGWFNVHTDGLMWTKQFPMKDSNNNYNSMALYKHASSGNWYMTPINGNISTDTSTNTWHHLVWVRDSGTSYLWVNGVQQTGVTDTVDMGTQNMHLGNEYSNSCAFNACQYDGLMDEVSIWDRALTNLEVTALYNSGSGTEVDNLSDLSNLIVYYDFEQTGNTLENQVTAPAPYTTNIDGMVDEYFISSEAYDSSEVDMIYEKGIEPTQIDTTGTTTDYDDSTAVGGTEYYYTVKATNTVGDSDFLTPFVSGLAGTPPGVPTGVSTAINNPNTNPLDITVSWSAPNNVGTGTLNAFEIYRDGTLITTTGLVTTYTDTVPTGGGTFEYKLKAVSTHGTSGFSSTTSTTTPSVPDTPAAPTGNINDPNGSPLDITVSWTAPNAGGSAITNYDLYRSSTSGSGFAIVQTGVTGLTHTDTTPSAGTWYYTVAANNLVGSSAQSPELSVSTPSVPSAVSDLAGNTVSDTAINLTWSAPSNGGSNIVDYTIYRDGVSIDTVTTPGYSDTGLTQQTSYTYTVYARNNVGTSLISNSISQETHGVPAVVPSFQATSAALDTITLSWGIPNDYNSAITNYVIERESPIGGGFQPLATVGTVTTYSDTGLTAVTEYNYRIKAVNAYGNSPTTTASTITLPAPPTNVFVTPSSSTSELTITWDEPTLTTGITGYQLQRENGIGNGFTTVTTTSGTSHLDTGLTTNIFYNYRLVSVSVQGNSDYSNTYAQTTFHLPDPVTVLSATAGTVADVTLDWTAPSIPYAAILGYTIYNVDAPGTTASATATLSTTLDQVSSITITDGGTQYSVAPTVTVSAPTGQLPHVTATATAAITNGVVTSITVTNNGDGYNTIPTVTLTSPSINTSVSGSTTLTPFIIDTGDITTSRTITGLEPSGTHNFAIAPITIHGSSILNAAIVSISPDVSFEGIVIDMPDEINPNENAIKFVKTQVGNNTNLTLEYNSALDVTCETTNPFSATTNTYPNLAETSIGNGKVTHTIAFNDSQNSIVDVMCYDVNDPTIKGQQRIQQNVIPLKDQMDDFNSNTFGTGSSFAAIDLMTLIVVIVGMIGFNRKNPAVGLALMAGLIGILTYFQVIELETSVIGGFTLVVFLAIAMGLKRS